MVSEEKLYVTLVFVPFYMFYMFSSGFLKTIFDFFCSLKIIYLGMGDFGFCFLAFILF